MNRRQQTGAVWAAVLVLVCVLGGFGAGGGFSQSSQHQACIEALHDHDEIDLLIAHALHQRLDVPVTRTPDELRAARASHEAVCRG